ncbi:MAG: ribonuclease III [Clostridia bacterium]|nr:ribonuclease III [Clostridia bacterium]
MLNIQEIEKKLDYTFKNKNYIISAVTHKSYAHEKKMVDLDAYNERLEFLGDALLEHSVSMYLFNITPKLTEGVMSKKRAQIVCEESLSDAVIQLGLDRYITLGNCELATNKKANVALLADMAEAIIAAVYLDSSFKEANKLIMKMLEEKIKEVLNSDVSTHDYKTKLQELLQKNGTVDIKYRLDKESGEAHNKVFYSSVYLNGEKIGEGNGKTKKGSEQEAACQALQKYKNI